MFTLSLFVSQTAAHYESKKYRPKVQLFLFFTGQGDDPNFIADSLVSGTEPTATTISDEHTDSTEKTVEKEPTGL